MKVFSLAVLLVSASAIKLEHPMVLSHTYYWPDYPKVTMMEPPRVAHSNRVKGLILNDDKFTRYHNSLDELNNDITHSSRDNYRWVRPNDFTEPK